MIDSDKDLGKLVAIHGIAPAYLQRAVFIVILSFVFFLAMMFMYYIRQSITYFLLASAFLVLYLVTLFSFVMQRRSFVMLHEMESVLRIVQPYGTKSNPLTIVR